MPLGADVNLGSGDVVLDGVAAPSYKGHSALLSVHVYCGETAGWIMMALSMMVGLYLGHIVLDGD